MSEHDESSCCSNKSLPCYSVDEQVLQILWEEGVDMNELLEFSFDRIEKLAKKHGNTISELQKEDLWEYVQRMRSEKSEWLSPSEIPTPGKTTGFWDSSIGPPPPSPVFGFAHATPMTSSPKVPATISSAVLALSPEIGFSTARHGVHGHRLGRIQGPSGRTPIPVLLTSPPKNPASAAASAVLVLSPEAGPPISRFGAISDGQRQAPCRLRSVRSLGTPRAERSPAEADVARSPQRGIGQRMKSFFTRTVRWKAPRDHAPTRLDIAPHLRVPSPVFRFHSSSKIGLMRERVPTFIRKSLRRRSGKYSMGARHQE
ncbi:unnamed protein product [Ixodes persulcatus]